MSNISSKKSLFIKLGQGGAWEKNCIENGLIRLGYNEADYESCKDRNWKKIEEHYLNEGKSQIATTGYITQIKYFFDEPEETIWITFYNIRQQYDQI